MSLPGMKSRIFSDSSPRLTAYHPSSWSYRTKQSLRWSVTKPPKRLAVLPQTKCCRGCDNMQAKGPGLLGRAAKSLWTCMRCVIVPVCCLEKAIDRTDHSCFLSMKSRESWIMQKQSRVHLLYLHRRCTSSRQPYESTSYLSNFGKPRRLSLQ